MSHTDRFAPAEMLPTMVDVHAELTKTVGQNSLEINSPGKKRGLNNTYTSVGAAGFGATAKHIKRKEAAGHEILVGQSKSNVQARS
jgi:hypothetical protein